MLGRNNAWRYVLRELRVKSYGRGDGRLRGMRKEDVGSLTRHDQKGAMQVIPQRATMTTGHQVQTRTKDTCNQRICLFNTHSFIHPRLPIPISTSLSHTPRSPLPPSSHQILVTGTATIHSVPNTHATHNQPPQWYYKEKKGPRRIKRNFRRLSRQMRMLKAESS